MPERNRDLTRRKFLSRMSIALLAGSWSPLSCGKRDFDVIFENGLVVNGSGEEPFVADLGISGERIVEIGKLRRRSARRRLDIKGLAIAPGFIDIHTHTDIELLVNPRAESKIRQGVTTEMSGQCGSSVAPLTPEMREEWNERLQKRYGLSVTWSDFDGFYQELAKEGIALNWSTMVGQGTLREYVLGMEDRPASPEDIKAMTDLIREALNQGVWGVSTGLEYTPGSFADTEEITQLCALMGSAHRYSGVYATHMRDEEDRVEEALAEAIEIAKNAHVPVEVSHLKAIGKRNWPKVDRLLRQINQAAKRGVRITADRYPYTAYSTGLSILFPLWSREGDWQTFKQRLQNPDLLPKIRQEVETVVERLGSWHQVLISGVQLGKNRWMQSRRLDDIAREMQMEPFEFTRQLLLEEPADVSMCGFGMSEENTRKILRHPRVAIGSDGNSLAATGPLAEGHPHPRSFGTFPRVLRKYVREDRALSLQEAVRKMSYLPASILAIPSRGLLQPGFFADIVVFDPDRVEDLATWAEPKRYPIGIPFVMVNGTFAIFEGEHTGALNGKILTRRFNTISKIKKRLGG